MDFFKHVLENGPPGDPWNLFQDEEAGSSNLRDIAHILPKGFFTNSMSRTEQSTFLQQIGPLMVMSNMPHREINMLLEALRKAGLRNTPPDALALLGITKKRAKRAAARRLTKSKTSRSTK